jgi:hypothetical protein
VRDRDRDRDENLKNVKEKKSNWIKRSFEFFHYASVWNIAHLISMQESSQLTVFASPWTEVFHCIHSWCDNFNRKAWEPSPITISLLFSSNLFAHSLLNVETSTLMWSSISYELTFQRNIPRFMFRADNKVVISEMKFIRWKYSCYSFQNSSVHRTERIPSCAQMKR